MVVPAKARQARKARPSDLPTPPASPNSAFEQNVEPWSAQYFDPGQRLQFLSTLGSGAYGVVHLAKDVTTQIPYAVKVLNKFNANGQPLDLRQQQFQHTEMQLHYEVSAHPNIVSLLRILDVADCTYVVMEYCPEGDLFSNITEQGRYVGNDLAAKSVFLQILDAVAHCHRLGVYHRDLKPENILVSDGGNQVKLADFGLATKDKYSTDFGCGSTFYMSPECHDQSSGIPYYACAPNDIWSLGVILVNLTCGRNPWKSASPKDSTYRAYMEDRHFLKSILPLSDELNEILGMIFEPDPSRRIKLEELRQRIIHCQYFTKKAAESALVPVDPILPDFEPFNEPLSPTSTLSEEGSMISDNSDNSTLPSEVDSDSESDLSFEIMDEDCDSPLQDFVTSAQPPPKTWDTTSILPSNCNPYVSDNVQAMHSNIVKPSNLGQAIPNNSSNLQISPVVPPVNVGLVSSGSMIDKTLNYHGRGGQSLAPRDQPTTQFSLLSAVPVPPRFQVPSIGQHLLNQFRPLGYQ